MLFIWFNKLVLVPFELIFWGNKVPFFYANNQSIYLEISIVLLSFVAFLCGWKSYFLKPSDLILNTFQQLQKWMIIYLSVALLSLIYLYGSLLNYWRNSIFTYATLDALEDVGGSMLGYLTNVGQRFWPFGVLLTLCWWKNKYANKQWQWIVWLVLCLVGTLSSNRSNMIYPLLMLSSILSSQWKLRDKRILLLVALGGFFSLLFFGYLRVQPTLDTEQVGQLFGIYLEESDYVWKAHQLYVGSPYQITPLLQIEKQANTLLASLLDPVPILGKGFREESGPFVYNLAIHDSTIAQDQVIPVAGELYFNGGFFWVALGYFIFGAIYHWFDAIFKKYILINPVLAASFFYLALLFNATLVLSLSVLVQFLLYNAVPALLIIVLNWWQMRKGSST